MALSVPYHPYRYCLLCGSSGNEAHSTKAEGLRKCSGCKQAIYCGKKCQRGDWNVHRRECKLLQDENSLASALMGGCPGLDVPAHVKCARSLREFFCQTRGDSEPLLFVLRELKRALLTSMPFWDPENPANNMAVDRMDTLIEAASAQTITTTGFTKNGGWSMKKGIDWIHLSSVLFGTGMVHRVINESARLGFRFGDNPWFESFLYNFEEVADRIKLYAILHENE